MTIIEESRSASCGMITLTRFDGSEIEAEDFNFMCFRSKFSRTIYLLQFKRNNWKAILEDPRKTLNLK